MAVVVGRSTESLDVTMAIDKEAIRQKYAKLETDELMLLTAPAGDLSEEELELFVASSRHAHPSARHR